MGVILYIGGQNTRVQGETIDLGGYRCFTAAHKKIIQPCLVLLAYWIQVHLAIL